MGITHRRCSLAGALLPFSPSSTPGVGMFILGKKSGVGIDPSSHAPIVVACATGIDHTISPIVPILLGALELPCHFEGLLAAGDG